MGYTTFLPENIFDLNVSYGNVVVVVILLIIVLIFGIGQYRLVKRKRKPE